MFSTVQVGELSTENSLVVDNSVMMRWLFDDGSASDRKYAAKTLEYINNNNPRVLVPYIWVYESSFVVNFYAGRGDLESGDAINHLESLFDLCTVAIDRETPATLFEFSSTHKVSAYDAAYLMLARAQESKLATLDNKMRRVARKLDMEILVAK